MHTLGSSEGKPCLSSHLVAGLVLSIPAPQSSKQQGLGFTTIQMGCMQPFSYIEDSGQGHWIPWAFFSSTLELTGNEKPGLALAKPCRGSKPSARSLPASFPPNSLQLSQKLPSSLKSFQKPLSHGDTHSQRDRRKAASCWTGMVVPAS